MHRQGVMAVTVNDSGLPLDFGTAAFAAPPMLWLTRFLARRIESSSRHFRHKDPDHLVVARRGEMEAYFHLREQGYRIVARNFRTPHNRGEIDIIAWDDGILCFVEVKTHANPGIVPPEVAVDAAKKKHIRSVARRYVQRLPGENAPACRFDIVSVVLNDGSSPPTIRLYQGAFRWSGNAEPSPSPASRPTTWWRRK